tara:strand:- start:42194 stop:42871 length:678 start_codon:yes stop_codon:yes gene_type:complete
VKRKSFYGIDCLVREGNSSERSFLIFHGYGANSSDLFPLADIFDPERKYSWYFPNGIQAAQFAGRAWFPIDMQAFEEAMRTGKPRSYADKLPPGLEDARQQVEAIYEELLEQYDGVTVGGFSQGAMLSVELALHVASVPQQLLLFSGTLVCKKRWQEKMKRLAGVDIFQSHGKGDEILNYDYAVDLKNLIDSSGLKVQFESFSGGHEIPPQVIERAKKFIQSVNR